jgi:protein arginine kinase activator
MVCDICNKNHATIHLTEIVDNKVVETHICQDCAREKAKALNEHLHLSGFVGGLAQNEDVRDEKEKKVVCSFCGYRYADFKMKGRLGCGHCYEAFRRQLVPLIKKIHGSIRHVGKVPHNLDQRASVDTELKEIRARLKRAIQLEEYEEAAALRDELKKLENKQ